MALPSLTQSLRPSLLSTFTTEWICHTCRRHQSSTRRTRKALRVKPDATFLPSKTETQDHIIFNPPSSAPSVYHTPQKFLPQNDPRRRLHSLALNSSFVSPSRLGGSLPSQQPPASSLATMRPAYEKKYHLTQEQIAEIKRLRAEDPRTWTRVKLAEKFKCSQFFVSLCCCAPEIKEERDKALEAVKAKWGERKREAREDRQTRKEGWGRDA
ncbi:hypothetical protein B0A48_17131 [Cryoendolithus antarcticus]|uniref:Uncharacterized protein n=1 Tax=Cryoendolithus antarcticus TaxID=1507870 RepID=A0A1V8SCF7_9PEZI|nr:hypothetical protein B0A48_17131 [Cryoendolithus antarcticus]